MLIILSSINITAINDILLSFISMFCMYTQSYIFVIVAKSPLVNAIAIDNVNINIAQHPSTIMICVIIFISFIILYLIIILSTE